MIRKLLLLAGTFAALLVAFLVYQFFTEQAKRLTPPDAGARGAPAAQTRSADRAGEGEELYVLRRVQGRLRGIYRAKKWTKLQGSTYLLNQPNLEVFQENGQRFRVRGDEAVVEAEEVSKGGFNPRRGTLKGNVRIVLDRSTDPDPAPPEQRPDDLVRISLHSLNFDNDLLRLDSNSYFELFSAEADILGKGISITWNDAPRELLELRITEGEQMTVKNVPEELDVISLPGGKATETGTAPAKGPPTSLPAAPDAAQAGATGPSAESSPSAESRPADTRPAAESPLLMHGTPESSPATQPVGETQPTTLATTEPQPRTQPAPAESQPQSKPSPESQPESQPQSNPSPGSQPESKPAAESQPTAESQPSAESQPASRPTTQTKPASQHAHEPTGPQNIYLATFSDPKHLINVDCGDRKLHGAKKLSLKFDWARGSLLTTRPAAPASSSAPATSAAPIAPGTSTAPATTPATTQAAPRRKGPPMIITWSGPLVLEQAGYTPHPSKNRFNVVAEGTGVVLADSKTTATCRTFVFDNPEQKGRLEGTEGAPARLVLPGGEEVVCGRMEFDRLAGEAVLVGEGSMTGLAERMAISQGATLPTTRAEGPEDSAVDRITWTRSVDVAFGKDSAPRPDGTAQTSQYIKEAVFHGDVKVNQGRTGDFVHCSDLQAFMGRGKGRSEFLHQAVAIGNVTARQERRDIQADRLTVDFEEVPEPNAAGKVRWRVRPATLLAEGAVKVSEESRDGREPLLATAERIESDLVRRSAVLKGRPAEIWQGVNRIEGAKIHLDEATESATVDGNGTLHFKTDKDFSGGRLAAPRLIAISWVDHMKYLGKRDTADFYGDVFLQSALDEMQCDEMHLLFEPRAPRAATTPASAPREGAIRIAAPRPSTEEAPSTAPSRPAADFGELSSTSSRSQPVQDSRAASRPRDRRLGLDVEDFSGRRIAIVRLDRKVKMNSTRLDEKDQLIQRVQLRGDQLRYDAMTDQVNTYGYGTFLSEDYRPPQPRKEAEPGGEGIDHPSQTAFEWHEFMSFSQKDRLVIMKGKVLMNHHSGKYLLQPEGLKIPPWPELKEGRSTRLACDKMEAKFAPPPSPASGPATSQTAPAASTAAAATTRASTASAATSRAAADWLSGPKVGPLERFTALQDVNMEDGVRQKRQIFCQRLLYDRKEDLVQIFGFLENQPPANATMLQEDLDTGRSEPVQSPKIIWFRKNDRIVTEKITGTGGR